MGRMDPSCILIISGPGPAGLIEPSGILTIWGPGPAGLMDPSGILTICGAIGRPSGPMGGIGPRGP